MFELSSVLQIDDNIININIIASLAKNSGFCCIVNFVCWQSVLLIRVCSLKNPCSRLEHLPKLRDHRSAAIKKPRMVLLCQVMEKLGCWDPESLRTNPFMNQFGVRTDSSLTPNFHLFSKCFQKPCSAASLRLESKQFIQMKVCWCDLHHHQQAAWSGLQFGAKCLQEFPILSVNLNGLQKPILIILVQDFSWSDLSWMTKTCPDTSADTVWFLSQEWRRSSGLGSSFTDRSLFRIKPQRWQSTIHLSQLFLNFLCRLCIHVFLSIKILYWSFNLNY